MLTEAGVYRSRQRVTAMQFDGSIESAQRLLEFVASTSSELASYRPAIAGEGGRGAEFRLGETGVFGEARGRLHPGQWLARLDDEWKVLGPEVFESRYELEVATC